MELRAWQALLSLGASHTQLMSCFRVHTPTAVCNLRMARIYMVQTPEQYVFVHRVLLDYIASKVRSDAALCTPSLIPHHTTR